MFSRKKTLEGVLSTLTATVDDLNKLADEARVEYEALDEDKREIQTKQEKVVETQARASRVSSKLRAILD